MVKDITICFGKVKKPASHQKRTIGTPEAIMRRYHELNRTWSFDLGQSLQTKVDGLNLEYGLVNRDTARRMSLKGIPNDPMFRV
jgi:hypothetical protein